MVKRPVRKRNREAGQAILLVIVASTIFLFGAVGLAIDGSHMYAQRQMAQSAADAGAEAGILSMFNGTNTGGAHPFTASSTVATCADGVPTPCYYAQRNGFDPTSDTVTYDAPAASQLRVTVQRSVSTTLIRFLGPTAATIRATATAAIVNVPAAIPIIVTHPDLSGALSFNGTPDIVIVGGPNRSIQVNSASSTSIATNACGNATVDLRLAGPNGNGADFGDNGGGPSACFTFLPGVGQYVQPATAIPDPLSGVAVPSSAGLVANPPTTTVPVGTNGCPSISGTTLCTVFHPGLYSTTAGITVKDSTNNSNGMALFAPGLYYISQGGFNMQAKASAQMGTGMAADPLHPEIGTAGMVVFNSGTGNGDIFNFDANAGKFAPIALQGAPDASIWDGILFFQDPNPATGGSHTGIGANKSHSIQGAGNITLTGTMYFNQRSGVTSTAFESLAVQGGSGSTTTLSGEIITQTLSLGGNGTIHMNLNSLPRNVQQVALIH
jgi:Flp pilus assembly protein TadG